MRHAIDKTDLDYRILRSRSGSTCRQEPRRPSFPYLQAREGRNKISPTRGAVSVFLLSGVRFYSGRPLSIQWECRNKAEAVRVCRHRCQLGKLESSGTGSEGARRLHYYPTCVPFGMKQPVCPYCAQEFIRSRFHPDQVVCSSLGCQRRRRADYHRKKLAEDPEYRAQSEDSKAHWRKNNPNYLKQYRATRTRDSLF
jgi:hypothetical protein